MKPEWELVQRARQGDEASFAALVEQNQGRIYNLALRMTGSPEDAADLCQEAFLNAWRGLGKFQGESSFATWLYRLTTNVCIDFLRREKRRQELSMTVSLDDEAEDRQAQLPDERFSPHLEAERQERRVSSERQASSERQEQGRNRHRAPERRRERAEMWICPRRSRRSAPRARHRTAQIVRRPAPFARQSPPVYPSLLIAIAS